MFNYARFSIACKSFIMIEMNPYRLPISALKVVVIPKYEEFLFLDLVPLMKYRISFGIFLEHKISY